MARLDDLPVPTASLDPDPSVLAEASAEQREVLRAVATLTPHQQEVVRLRFQSDLSYKEISAVTGDSVTNVGYLLHTALATVRARLRESAGEAMVAEGGLS